ncbi:MAG: hypothetical protein QXJ17_02225 [Nitrososphaeria archaeon]
MLDVTITREVKIKLYRFVDYFKGFENVEVVRNLFGKDVEKTLSRLKVEFFSSRYGYMGVNPDGGHLMVSTYYLKNGSEKEIYLDIIHELCHIKQYLEGKELFDDRFSYVERPTEVEAYKLAVSEARRIGMTDDEIYSYLKTEWISEDDLKRLAIALNVTPQDKINS